VDNFYCSNDIIECEEARLDIISNTESWSDSNCGGQSAKWNGSNWLSKYVKPAEPAPPPPPPPPIEPEFRCEKVPSCTRYPGGCCGTYGSCKKNELGQTLYIGCNRNMAGCDARREAELAASRINATSVFLSAENRECLDADSNNALWLPEVVDAFQGKDYKKGWRN